jgi:hypothetical protein
MDTGQLTVYYDQSCWRCNIVHYNIASPLISHLPLSKVINLTKTIIMDSALIKKKIKFSSNIGKFRVEQLQSHI